MPTGEYAVGVFTYTVHNDREETMYNALGTMRSIPVKVYYPAAKESVKGLTKARYMSKATVDAIRKNFYVPIKYEKVESDGTNRSECYENAPFMVFHKRRMFPCCKNRGGNGGNIHRRPLKSKQQKILQNIQHPGNHIAGNDGISFGELITQEKEKHGSKAYDQCSSLHIPTPYFMASSARAFWVVYSWE